MQNITFFIKGKIKNTASAQTGTRDNILNKIGPAIAKFWEIIAAKAY